MTMRRFFTVLLAAGLVLAACGGSSDSEEPLSEDTLDDSTTTSSAEPAEASASSDTSADGGFIVRDGDIVEVHYVGTLDDGSVFDSSRERDSTFTFTVGSGQVISGFDEAVRGGQVGDVNTSRMEAADAYGEKSDENILVVPYNPDQGDVKVGDEVFLTNGQPAVILEVTEETVTLDANHRLAGEALTFEIEILSITRE
ncbi:MAG: FKBP-type peptidyl-prolyl cis-trans isomerase [Acidimicrobiia bacterium]